MRSSQPITITATGFFKNYFCLTSFVQHQCIMEKSVIYHYKRKNRIAKTEWCYNGMFLRQFTKLRLWHDFPKKCVYKRKLLEMCINAKISGSRPGWISINKIFPAEV